MPSLDKLIPWAIGLVALSVVAVSWPAMTWVRRVRGDEEAHERAERLLRAGDLDGAVAEVDQRLADGHAAEGLEKTGGEALEGLLDRRLEAESPGQALEWVRAELPRHVWYHDTPPRLHELETVVAMEEAAGKGEGEEEALTRMLTLYPKDPGVPYAGARALIAPHPGHTVLPQSALAYYEMALDRGGYRGDPAILQACLDTFHDFDPTARWSDTCQRILRRHYPEERGRWAQKALDQGNADEVLNAIGILDEEKDPRVGQSFFLALRAALSGSGEEAPYRTLLEEKDPALRRRAGVLARDALRHLDSSRPDAGAGRLKKLAALEDG